MKFYKTFKIATIILLTLSILLNIFTLNFSPTTLVHLCALVVIFVTELDEYLNKNY